MIELFREFRSHLLPSLLESEVFVRAKMKLQNLILLGYDLKEMVELEFQVFDPFACLGEHALSVNQNGF